MSGIVRSTGNGLDVETTDEFIQRQWDNFVFGENVSLGETTSLSSCDVKTDLRNWAIHTAAPVEAMWGL